ncbi:MAG TPA: hypothetical protein VFU19_16565 [Iamia sp.]|nr:hypothetical protein [Iamia sp.]
MNRPLLAPAGVALAILLALAAAAHTHPIVRPLVERLAVLTVAGLVIAALVMAAGRAHPEPAVTDLDPSPLARAEPAALPQALRRVAGTFDRPVGVGSWRGQNVGGRSHVHRLGRERLAARGLDVDDPDHEPAVRALAGEHLWVLVSTPLDRPVRNVDLDAALDRLEAL